MPSTGDFWTSRISLIKRFRAAFIAILRSNKFVLWGDPRKSSGENGLAKEDPFPPSRRNGCCLAWHRVVSLTPLSLIPVTQHQLSVTLLCISAVSETNFL
jgi:hypothetical protein